MGHCSSGCGSGQREGSYDEELFTHAVIRWCVPIALNLGPLKIDLANVELQENTSTATIKLDNFKIRALCMTGISTVEPQGELAAETCITRCSQCCHGSRDKIVRVKENWRSGDCAGVLLKGIEKTSDTVATGERYSTRIRADILRPPRAPAKVKVHSLDIINGPILGEIMSMDSARKKLGEKASKVMNYKMEDSLTAKLAAAASAKAGEVQVRQGSTAGPGSLQFLPSPAEAPKGKVPIEERQQKARRNSKPAETVRH